MYLSDPLSEPISPASGNVVGWQLSAKVPHQELPSPKDQILSLGEAHSQWLVNARIKRPYFLAEDGKIPKDHTSSKIPIGSTEVFVATVL